MMKIDLLLLACLAALASCETFKTFKSDNGYQSYKSDGSDACEVFTKFHYSWSFDFDNLPKYLADTVEMTVSNLWPNTPALKPFVGKKMTRDEVANWCALIGASSAWYRVSDNTAFRSFTAHCKQVILYFPLMSLPDPFVFLFSSITTVWAMATRALAICILSFLTSAWGLRE